MALAKRPSIPGRQGGWTFSIAEGQQCEAPHGSENLRVLLTLFARAWKPRLKRFTSKGRAQIPRQRFFDE